jgi:hypothetical protein
MRERTPPRFRELEPHIGGPGTELKKLLGWFGLRAKGKCRCDKRARTMNAWGPKKCLENMETILDWLQEEAGMRGLPFIRALAKPVVLMAVHMSERRLPDGLNLELGQTVETQREWLRNYARLPERKYWGWLDGDELPAPTTRHLLMHIWPRATSPAWRRNVDQVLQRIDQFNGKRVVAIAYDRACVRPEEVQRLFAGHDIEFITVLNDPVLREVITMFPLWERVRTDDPTHITFYCHSKGVTRQATDTVHRWTEIMYGTCLDRPDLVDAQMQQYPLTGTFKKLGPGFQGSRSQWHYSGTFYWINNAALLRRPWQQIDRVWWGVESWPSLIFSHEQAGCLLYEASVPQLNLYNRKFFDARIEPAYQEWQQDAKGVRL